MQWILSLNTTHEAIDWVSTLLAATDYIEDIRITKYTKPDLDQLSNWDLVQPCWAFTIYLYLPDDVNACARVEQIDNLLSPLHRTNLTTALQITRVEEQSAHIGEPSPLIHRIGQRFVVLTPDTPYQAEAADEVTLRLRRTLTFGSGLHPTTIVSLQLLERYVTPNMQVLDLGAGSGILSVAMAKLGAKVLALDNDRIAVRATQDAIRQNGVQQQVMVMEGSLGSGNDLGHWMGRNTSDNLPTINVTPIFDLIVANILARVHIALAHDFQQALRTDAHIGFLITAGFTTDYEDEVDAALIEAGFEAIDYERRNEWVALAHRLKAW